MHQCRSAERKVGLADNVHDATEIVNPERFSYERGSVGVKEDEIEGPVSIPGRPERRKSAPILVTEQNRGYRSRQNQSDGTLHAQ